MGRHTFGIARHPIFQMFPKAQGIEEVFIDFSIEGEEYSVKSIENIFTDILYMACDQTQVECFRSDAE